MLDIDLWTVVWTGVNLIVLYLLMRKFLFGPVTAVMEQRKQEIAQGLENAEAARQQLVGAETDCRRQLDQARGQADQLLAQARQRGEQAYQQQMYQAKTDAEALLAAGRRQNDLDRQAMLDGVRQEVASLALLAAAKVSRQAMDRDGERQLVEDFLRQEDSL